LIAFAVAGARGIEAATIVSDVTSPLVALSNLDYHDAAFPPPAVG
jgi:hypothetical protein